jgi:translation initiation factor 1
MCPVCGWPIDDCKCSSANRAESVPSRIVAKLRIEKAGRGGKTVTVVDGLPNNATFLKELVQELKKACGVGGAGRCVTAPSSCKAISGRGCESSSKRKGSS